MLCSVYSIPQTNTCFRQCRFSKARVYYSSPIIELSRCQCTKIPWSSSYTAVPLPSASWSLCKKELENENLCSYDTTVAQMYKYRKFTLQNILDICTDLGVVRLLMG